MEDVRTPFDVSSVLSGQGLAMTRPEFEFEVIAPAGDIVYRRMMIPGVH